MPNIFEIQKSTLNGKDFQVVNSQLSPEETEEFKTQFDLCLKAHQPSAFSILLHAFLVVGSIITGIILAFIALSTPVTVETKVTTTSAGRIQTSVINNNSGLLLYFRFIPALVLVATLLSVVFYLRPKVLRLQNELQNLAQYLSFQNSYRGFAFVYLSSFTMHKVNLHVLQPAQPQFVANIDPIKE